MSKQTDKESSQLDKELCRLAVKKAKNKRAREIYTPKSPCFETEKRVYNKSNHQSDDTTIVKKSKCDFIFVLLNLKFI